MLVVERLAFPRYIINFPTKKHWSRPSQLSFRVPFGMELLATVHWARAHEGARTLDEAVQRVAGWSGRKRSLMKPGHIRAARDRLEKVGREAGAAGAGDGVV